MSKVDCKCSRSRFRELRLAARSSRGLFLLRGRVVKCRAVKLRATELRKTGGRVLAGRTGKGRAVEPESCRRRLSDVGLVELLVLRAAAVGLVLGTELELV